MGSWRLRHVAAVLALVSAAAACGSTAPEPLTTPARASGQSGLLGSTFAGKDRCDPREHDRPFVVEWDATDLSSFQARAINDVVFVRFEGCHLSIVDSCNDDSVRGRLGSYKPIEWTSGAVEKVDIDNLVDLYAKLPLGVTLLGGRVESGEKFHMEYFVSGTRTATRPAVHAADLAPIPGCAGVTHFVYGYNVGAFALGSRSKITGDTRGVVFGKDSRFESAIDKKAGELGSCRGESAREVEGCKVPIRLSLRPIAPGESNDAVAARAPETPDAANLAGKLRAETDQQRQAGEHYNAAQAKLTSGDGRGCLAELDAHDRLDPRPGGLSTAPGGGLRMRALCVMLSGQCEAGRQMSRRMWQATDGGRTAPERIDLMVDSDVATHCRGGTMSDRDRLLRALYVLSNTNERVALVDCQKAYDTGRALLDKVPSGGDGMLHDPEHMIRMSAPACFARAGDCAGAWRAATERMDAFAKKKGDKPSDDNQRSNFISMTGTACFDKDQGQLTDTQAVFRAVHELRERSRVGSAGTAAWCTARIDLGRRALEHTKEPRGELEQGGRYLAAAAVECLGGANDCEAAWKQWTSLERAYDPHGAKDERQLRYGFRDKVKACRFKPQGAMSQREKIFWADGLIEDAWRDHGAASVCLTGFEALKRAVPPGPVDRRDFDLHNVTNEARRAIGRCLGRANDCAGAFRAYTEADARFSDRPEKDPQRLRDHFERDVGDCKGK